MAQTNDIFSLIEVNLQADPQMTELLEMRMKAVKQAASEDIFRRLDKAIARRKNHLEKKANDARLHLMKNTHIERDFGIFEQKCSMYDEKNQQNKAFMLDISKTLASRSDETHQRFIECHNKIEAQKAIERKEILEMQKKLESAVRAELQNQLEEKTRVLEWEKDIVIADLKRQLERKKDRIIADLTEQLKQKRARRDSTSNYKKVAVAVAVKSENYCPVEIDHASSLLVVNSRITNLRVLLLYILQLKI